MKQALGAGGVARQGLLIPEVVELDEPAAAERLVARARRAGASSAWCSKPSAPAPWWCARCPALLGEADVNGLVRDLADELAEFGSAL